MLLALKEHIYCLTFIIPVNHELAALVFREADITKRPVRCYCQASDALNSIERPKDNHLNQG